MMIRMMIRMMAEIRQQVQASIAVKKTLLAEAQILMQIESLVKLSLDSQKGGVSFANAQS